MRTSDERKNDFKSRFHDTQIDSTKHDEIVIWLYGRLKNDEKLVREITRTEKCKEIKLISVEIEKPFGGERVAGFADLAVCVQINVCVADNPKDTWRELQWGFVEVKTSVNIGETIRQIKYYSRHFHNRHHVSDVHHCPWTVCAPKFAHASLLKEQDINFIPYDP